MQFTIFLAFIFGHHFNTSGETWGKLFEIIGNLEFWLSTLLVVAVIILPFYISRRSEFLFSNDIVNNLIQERYEYDIAKKKYYKKLDGVINCINSIAKFKKLYKLDKDFEVENYADKKMKEIVDLYKIEYLDKNEIVKNHQENKILKKKVEFADIDDNIKLKTNEKFERISSRENFQNIEIKMVFENAEKPIILRNKFTNDDK